MCRARLEMFSQMTRLRKSKDVMKKKVLLDYGKIVESNVGGKALQV